MSALQQRLADWQRRQGTTRVVVLVTLFSVVTSCMISYGLVVAIHGFDGLISNLEPLILVLPIAVPLLVAPVVTFQMSTTLATAATLIDELSTARTALQREVVARQAAQLELQHLAHPMR